LKYDDWPRINFVGKKLPLSFDLENPGCLGIVLFEQLRDKKTFEEVYNKSYFEIMK
jgi:hypothetical protein